MIFTSLFIAAAITIGEASPWCVTYAEGKRFFVQNDSAAQKVVTARGKLPSVGELVSVTGSAGDEGGRRILLADGWKPCGRTAPPVSRKVTADDLVDPSSDSVNWQRVTVEGRAIELTGTGFALDVGGVPVTVLVREIPGFLDGCGTLHPLVRATGVVEMILDPSVGEDEGRSVLGVKLSPASEADIEFLPDAVYYLNRGDRKTRFVVCTVVSALALAALAFAFVIVRQRRRHFRTATLMAERKRMADAIHDAIEQHLVGAGMLLQLNRNKEAREILLRAKAELRDIVWGLKNDDMMRLTPAEMLRKTAETETKKGLFRVTTRLAGLPDRMSAKAMRDLSLIVREAIGNAVKHGGAKKIAITCDPEGAGGWLLRIANDGTPFDPARAPGAGEGHFGLSGMRERAKRLGATLEIFTDRLWTVVALKGDGRRSRGD